ncbi:MAG: hypothetical protein AB8B63_20750 [Granulosicoccus sp.]
MQSAYLHRVEGLSDVAVSEQPLQRIECEFDMMHVCPPQCAPHPFISGVITASAIIIAASQLKHLHCPTLVLGVVATAFLFWVRKALAATIVVAVLSLVDPDIFRQVWKYSRADFTAVLVTVLLTLSAGMLFLPTRRC